MPSSDMNTLPLFLLTGIACFLMGAIFQQDVSLRCLIKLMQRDPYIFETRNRIFSALSLFGDETRDFYSLSLLITRKNGHWLRKQLYNLLSFFFANLDEADESKKFKKLETQLCDIMKYGFPGLDDIHVYNGFVLSYDRRNRVAHWVCEHIRPECIEKSCSNTNSNDRLDFYTIDEKIPKPFRNITKEILNKEYGQLAAPSNHKYNEEAYHDTFVLSNSVPHGKGLKSQAWQQLEEYIREQARLFGSVYVYSGPLYMPRRMNFRKWAVCYNIIGMNNIAVPTHFFKVIIFESKYLMDLPYMEGYVMPNADIKIDEENTLSSFLCNINDIEHYSGLKFYNGLRQNYFSERNY